MLLFVLLFLIFVVYLIRLILLRPIRAPVVVVGVATSGANAIAIAALDYLVATCCCC